MTNPPQTQGQPNEQSTKFDFLKGSISKSILIINIILITYLVFMIRKPRFDPKRARETCRLCGQKKVGKKSTKKSDCEKQQ